jgi:peptidoglycan hydrolase-like protein with peptidoglycan-binding domain
MFYIPLHAKTEIEFPGLIQRGSSGTNVRRVQEWLTFHGCATGIDGGFGPATERAVQAFQAKKQLSQSGSVDRETWGALVEPLHQALSVSVSRNDTLDTAVLKVAKAHLLHHPIELGGDNKGPWVRLYADGHDGGRWCAAFVTFILKQACHGLECGMPITGSTSCDSLAKQARDRDLFVSGKSIEDGTTPWGRLGQCQIFLVRESATDWTHTGFCFEGANDVFSTIEGNTNDEGNANGYEVCRRTRSLAKKDFIRISS